ncbi:MAG: aldo/keto reductase [Candidatus Cybelea sp.]
MQLHTVDPTLAYSEQIGALVELQREGKIRHIGVSNVDI